MKKFAFLLAMVAVFAMIAAAFAANAVSITDMSNVADTSIAGNISNIGKVTATKDIDGKVVSAIAPIYVISGDDRVDSLMAYVSASVSAATDGTTNSKTIQGVLTPAKLKNALNGSDAALQISEKGSESSDAPRILFVNTSLYPVSLDLVPAEIKVNAIGYADAALTAGKSSDLTLVKTAVYPELQSDQLAIVDGVVTLKIAGIGEAKDAKIVLGEANGLGLHAEQLLYQAQLNTTAPLWLTGVTSDSKFDSTTAGKIGNKFNFALSDDMSITISADKTVVSGDKFVINVFSNQDNLIVSDDGVCSSIAGITDIAMDPDEMAKFHGDLVAKLTIAVISSDTELEADELDAELAKPSSDIIVGTPKGGANTVVMSGDQLVFNDAKAGEINSEDIAAGGLEYQIVILAEDGKSVSKDAYPDVTMTYTLSADSTPQRLVDIQTAGFEFGISKVTFPKSHFVANYARTSSVSAASASEYGTDFIIGAKSSGSEPKVDDYKFYVANSYPQGGRSSSGACDMGFGLFALAALALRRRGK